MNFTELASHVDPALPDAGARSRKRKAKKQRRASVEPNRPSTKLRRPPSFERIRPPQVYERGRTGFYEQRPGSRSRSGWRYASSSRSSRGSFVSLIDPKQVLGRDMQEQRERDISLLDERSPKISRLGDNEQSTGPRRSGHKIYEKHPSDSFYRNWRPEVPSRATQGTMVVYRERKAEDQPTEDSLRKGRESIFESTTDVDRETLVIRKGREKRHEGTKELSGSPHGSDFDPTASFSKGALVLYQGEKARDETPQELRRRYHRKSSDNTSISQRGALVIHRGEETSVETTQQLPGRCRNDSVDTTNSHTVALVVSNGERSTEELPERTRKPVERNTNQVKDGEMSSDNSERETSIHRGLPHEPSSPISEDGPYGSDLVEIDMSLENNLEDLSDESSRPKKDSRASIGDFQESFSDDDITIRRRRPERRTFDRFRKYRYDGDNRSWSDNRRSSDHSQYSSSIDSPHERPKTQRPFRTYERKLPSTRGSRRAKQTQRKEAAVEKSTKRRVRMGHQQTIGNSNNDYVYMNPNSARLEGSDAHHAPGMESLLEGSKQLIRGKASPADMGMRTLLVYRAVLFATLCALAADTSCVHETELGRRIVQVL